MPFSFCCRHINTLSSPPPVLFSSSSPSSFLSSTLHHCPLPPPSFVYPNPPSHTPGQRREVWIRNHLVSGRSKAQLYPGNRTVGSLSCHLPRVLLSLPTNQPCQRGNFPGEFLLRRRVGWVVGLGLGYPSAYRFVSVFVCDSVWLLL